MTIDSDTGAATTLYSGVVLLGWMEQHQAIRFLREDCWFEQTLSDDAGLMLWQQWRDRACAIAERAAPAPEPVQLTEAEQVHAENFLKFVASVGATNTQVVKIDPMQLVVAQHHIAIEVAASHGEKCTRDADWMQQALPLQSTNPNLSISFTRRNLDTDIDIDLPHAEFLFGVHPQGGFGPKELLGHISVVRAGSRMLLGKGYHRLYGRMMQTEGRFPERLSLVALNANSVMPPSGTPTRDLDIFGTRPPIFADFFTEGLAMPVHLKRKRYQLQVRSRWIALSE